MHYFDVEYTGCGEECQCITGFEFCCPNCGYVQAETLIGAELLLFWDKFKNHLPKTIVLKCPDCGFTIESEPLSEERHFLVYLRFKEVSNGQS